MASTRYFPSPRRAIAAAALAALGGSAWAQSADQQVTVTSRAPAVPASVSGFGDVPPERSPFAASTTTTATLRDLGIDTLGEATKLDASIGDAYNPPGYWASLRVRGYALDNRFNYRRDGLPISGETALLFDNKERLEVLKGTSGAQAGTSAPGGLVNLVVKRPRGDSTTLLAGLADSGSVKLGADIDRRLGDDTGVRLNLAAERMNPRLRDTEGSRWLAAVAAETRLGAGRLEAEAEISYQSQPSVPGFSLLGSVLPSPRSIDPRTNLNNQPWSLPVVFDSSTASLRYSQPLAEGWRVVAHAATQQLRTDDRIAFPFGCSAENNYSSYCSDGSFDLYDFRSEGERRQTDAATLRLEGSLQTGALRHELGLGVLASRYRQRMGLQAYNWAGVGTVDGGTVVPAAPDTLDQNTERTERSTEWQLTDRIALGDWGLWLGLRHTDLHRESVRTDGSRPTAYSQGFATPWLATTWQLTPQDMVYASWGRGVESAVTPNKPAYGAAAGQALPALRSRQGELGWKHDERAWAASAVWFDIRRPYLSDTGSRYGVDGAARHRGLELAGDLRWDRFSLRGTAMWLDAEREDAASAADNGKTPENVARRTLRAQLGWQPQGVSGLQLAAQLSLEGPRFVLPDNSLAVGAWTTLGLNARYAWRQGAQEWIWRAGVDNVFDRRAWQETPYQYGHVYLYPLAARTFRTSFQVNL
jgi:iron complex outermembrane receptor protein